MPGTNRVGALAGVGESRSACRSFEPRIARILNSELRLLEHSHKVLEDRSAEVASSLHRTTRGEPEA